MNLRLNKFQHSMQYKTVSYVYHLFDSNSLWSAETDVHLLSNSVSRCRLDQGKFMFIGHAIFLSITLPRLSLLLKACCIYTSLLSPNTPYAFSQVQIFLCFCLFFWWCPFLLFLSQLLLQMQINFILLWDFLRWF